MMSLNNPFNEQHVVVSLELLRLLYWLIEHEQESLKRLMRKALDQQITAQPQSIESFLESDASPDQAAHLFILLEALLNEVLAEQTETQQLQVSTVPALRNIDSSQCSEELIHQSIAKATATKERSPERSSLLLREANRLPFCFFLAYFNTTLSQRFFDSPL